MKNRVAFWILLVGGAIVLIAGHGIILSYVSSQMALSMAAIAGLIAVVVVVHLGLFGSLSTVLRNALRRHKSGDAARKGLH